MKVTSKVLWSASTQASVFQLQGMHQQQPMMSQASTYTLGTFEFVFSDTESHLISPFIRHPQLTTATLFTDSLSHSLTDNSNIARLLLQQSLKIKRLQG